MCSNSPEEKFPPKRKCGELLRRFSTLPAAGAAVRGLAPLLPAPPGGPPVGQGERFQLKRFTAGSPAASPAPPSLHSTASPRLLPRKCLPAPRSQGTHRGAFTFPPHQGAAHSGARPSGFRHHLFLPTILEGRHPRTYDILSHPLYDSKPDVRTQERHDNHE